MLCLLLVTLKVTSANSVTLKVTSANSVTLKVTSANSLGPHCVPVCKNRFKKFARIFSRRHKQTTFSDVGFLGALRVNNGYDGANIM